MHKRRTNVHRGRTFEAHSVCRGTHKRCTHAPKCPFAEADTPRAGPCTPTVQTTRHQLVLERPAHDANTTHTPPCITHKGGSSGTRRTWRHRKPVVQAPLCRRKPPNGAVVGSWTLDLALLHAASVLKVRAERFYIPFKAPNTLGWTLFGRIWSR